MKEANPMSNEGNDDNIYEIKIINENNEEKEFEESLK